LCCLWAARQPRAQQRRVSVQYCNGASEYTGRDPRSRFEATKLVAERIDSRCAEGASWTTAIGQESSCKDGTRRPDAAGPQRATGQLCDGSIWPTNGGPLGVRLTGACPRLLDALRQPGHAGYAVRHAGLPGVGSSARTVRPRVALTWPC
jgi:hypothetical protein